MKELLRGWAPFAVLAGLALAAFAGSIPSEFVYDDLGGIRENPAVNGVLPVSAILTHDFWGREAAHTVDTYRPVVVALFRAVWTSGFGTPAGYRALALLLHISFVCVAFGVLRTIVPASTAFLAAAMQAVCCATSEAILSHVANADILCATGTMLGLAAYRSNRPFAGLATAGAFLLAVGSKESGLFAPIAWVLFDVFLPSQVNRRSRVIRSAGCAAVAIPYLIGRHFATGAFLIGFTPDSLRNPLYGLSPFARLLGAGRVFAERYLLGLLLPWRRTHDCSANACGPVEWGDAVAWLGVALWILLCMAPVFLRRRNAVAAAGLAWFAVFFTPVSNFVIAAVTVYGERLLYLPGIGLFLAVAEAARVLTVCTARPALVYGAATAVLTTNLACDRKRIADWQSHENLALSALAYAPNSALVLGNLAVVARKKGDYAAVERYARQAIAISPSMMKSHRELASALFVTGQMAEARKEFEAAYALGSDERLVFDYASFLATEGEFQGATQIVEEYLSRYPNQPTLVALDKKLKQAWLAAHQ